MLPTLNQFLELTAPHHGLKWQSEKYKMTL